MITKKAAVKAAADIEQYAQSVHEELVALGVDSDAGEIHTAVAMEWPYGKKAKRLLPPRDMAAAVKLMMEDELLDVSGREAK